MSTETVVIVDPYSSGPLLVDEFKGRGLDCLAVSSSPTIPDIYRSSFHPESFTQLIQSNGNLDETVQAIKQYSVRCVVPGCDLGVGLADELGEALGLPGNAPELKQARTDKFSMLQRACAQGVQTPAQFSSASLDAVVAWTRTRKPSPIVIKPLNSTSSEGVFICSSEAEIRTAYLALMGRRNALGRVNDAVLVQEFLTGTEYVVDTVSRAGMHQAAAFWVYRKSSLAASMAGPECIELLPIEGETQQELFAFAQRVLNALGIRYGAAHIELIWSAQGPVLVEMGARVNGGNNPLICSTCTGTSQIQMLADAYLENETWGTRTRPNGTHKKGMRVFLIPRRKGQYRNRGALDQFRSLESFHDLYVGSRQSWDAPRRLGWVILVHADASVVERDLARIRELEETEIYTN